MALGSTINATPDVTHQDIVSALRPTAMTTNQWMIDTPRGHGGRRGLYKRNLLWTAGGFMAFMLVFFIIFGAGGIIPALQFLVFAGFPLSLFVRFFVFKEHQRRKELRYQDEYDLEIDPSDFFTLTTITPEGVGFYSDNSAAVILKADRKPSLGMTFETAFNQRMFMQHLLNSWHQQSGIQFTHYTVNLPSSSVDPRFTKMWNFISDQKDTGARKLVRAMIDQVYEDGQTYVSSIDYFLLIKRPSRSMSDFMSYVSNLRSHIIDSRSPYRSCAYLDYVGWEEFAQHITGIENFDLHEMIEKSHQSEEDPFRVLWVEDREGNIIASYNDVDEADDTEYGDDDIAYAEPVFEEPESGSLSLSKLVANESTSGGGFGLGAPAPAPSTPVATEPDTEKPAASPTQRSGGFGLSLTKTGDAPTSINQGGHTNAAPATQKKLPAPRPAPKETMPARPQRRTITRL